MAKRTTVKDIEARKGGAPLVCLTAYTYPIARLLDEAVDILLVGDSLGMVVYGHETTLGVTLEHMIAHGEAVARATKSALVVVDMPFGSYEEGPDRAFRSAKRILAETRASAVKLEGGATMAPTIRFLVERGVPVMGHVGLLPQHVNAMGGFKTQGREDAAADRIFADAQAVCDAGIFSIVIEGVVEPLAERITQAVPVPAIGIGASAACDGQILVTDDVIGLTPDFAPSFVKRYDGIGDRIAAAARAYAEDVRSRRFPGPEHVRPG